MPCTCLTCFPTFGGAGADVVASISTLRPAGVQSGDTTFAATVGFATTGGQTITGDCGSTFVLTPPTCVAAGAGRNAGIGVPDVPLNVPSASGTDGRWGLHRVDLRPRSEETE